MPKDLIRDSAKNLACSGMNVMKKIFTSLCVLMFSPTLLTAQFNSGSTGADGALDLSTVNCNGNPNNACEIQLPESGVLNYTNVNIRAGTHLSFRKNTRNTPVIILATGSVVIDGEIDVSPPFGTPYGGPGGFNGGKDQGFGPGGGNGFEH